MDLRLAKDLVELLQETKQLGAKDNAVIFNIPVWLRNEAKDGKLIHRRNWDYKNRNRSEGGAVANAGGGGGAEDWMGRGKGRRQVYLEELNGSGIARRLDLV